MTLKQMKELFGKTKSVPAGNKNTAKSKIQAKKIQQPSSTNAEQRKNIYPPDPAQQNVKHVVGDKFSKNPYKFSCLYKKIRIKHND